MPSTARDLMSPDPITIGYDMPVLQAQHLFVTLQISGAPVVDAGNRVMGVISSSDLLRIVDQVCDEDIDPMPTATADGLAERLSELLVGDVATPEVVWVAPETSVSNVAKLMRTEGIHRVLVGSSSRLEGILTAFDLLEALAGPP
jgi:CBS domain-containing membrane protein